MDRGPQRTLGERLREARTDRGWSQEWLARRVGVTKKAISKIERGETKEPSARNLGKIAEHLHVSVNWLIYGGNRPRGRNGTGGENVHD